MSCDRTTEIVSKISGAHHISALTDITHAIRDANPHDKAELYRELGLRLTYHPEKAEVLAEARPGLVCVKYVSEGGSNPDLQHTRWKWVCIALIKPAADRLSTRSESG